MFIDKDVKTFLEGLEPKEKIINTISQCSKNTEGIPMVNNTKLAYNFDEVVKALFNGDVPTSVDCICITNKIIDLIEFKDGLIDKYNKQYIDPEYTCQECKKLHKEVFDYHKKNREQQKSILDQNLRMKASESLLVLQNCILPYCRESPNEYQLRLVCVYKLGSIEPLDEYEVALEDLATPRKKVKDSETSNVIIGQLNRFAKEDIQKKHPFYESLFVCSNLEFQELKRYKSV